MKANINLDISGAVAKLTYQSNVPRAAFQVMDKWGAETVLRLKRAASGKIVGKYKSGRKSGQLHRSITHKAAIVKKDTTLLIGTGLSGAKSVIYAEILDIGSTRAIGGPITPKRAQYLTIPWPGVKGKARDQKDAFFIKSKKGNLLLVKKQGKRGKIKPLFTLKKEVTIKPFYWFTNPIKERKPFLSRDMRPEHLLHIAKGLAR